MAKKGPMLFLAYFLLLWQACLFFILAANAELSWQSDRSALLAFKSSSGAKLEGWNTSSNPCSGGWTGVKCRGLRVVSLILNGIDLSGGVDSLLSLSELRILSLKGQGERLRVGRGGLNGTLPTDMSEWARLKFLYLPENHLSGPLPDSLSSLSRLFRLDLSSNNLNGTIPPSLLTSLPRILTLRLGNNRLSGFLPDVNLTGSHLEDFNVSDNILFGPIPSSLSRFPIASFRGNPGLCGSPLLLCSNTTTIPPSTNPSTPTTLTPTPTPTPTVLSSDSTSKPTSVSGGSKLGSGAIAAIVVGDIAILSIVVCFILLVVYWRKYSLGKRSGKSPSSGIPSEKLLYSPPASQNPASLGGGATGGGDGGRLVFVDGRKQFELEDLLRASAEMLGKGSFGTAYRAILEDGSIVAVKRLKDINVPSHKEFGQHMELIGRLRHPNLVCLRAHFYAKTEKLLVFDYFPNGSLYALLHGNRGPGRTPLDWTTRVKIALGAARGLAYIHSECKAHKTPHGNVKSSNVLLDKNGNARLSDFGLAAMAAGGCRTSTKVEEGARGRLSKKGDVYSFGVLLLEMLTGKAPTPDRRSELPNWVRSVVTEEWTAEVFDLELLKYKSAEEEMVSMLHIAMSCTSDSPDSRPEMSRVVETIEEIVGGDEDPSPQRSLDSISQSPTSEPALASG